MEGLPLRHEANVKHAHRKETQFRRNRGQMLEKVRFIWIKGLLESSLYDLARVELGLKTKPDAVTHPFDLIEQRLDQAPQPLPPGMPIRQIFDNAGKALLILGEPGAGKTTLLLELTCDLLNQAAQDESYWIPVVFNLSSWAEQQLALADWLIDELNKRYDVPRTLAQTWVDAELILPLLDGLDEVAADHRQDCAEAINAFRSKYGLLPMVVCSRVAEFEALTVRLRLTSAVIIQALSREQIKTYVDQAGVSLAGLRTVLQDDEILWELLNTPLMLSIMALAYKGRSADEIHSSGTVEEHRTQLFVAYTNAMFHRHTKTTPYTREQTEHWLTWLAKAMKGHNQSVFYLEWIQPDWLSLQRQQRLVTFVTSVMGGLFGGLFGGLLDGLYYGKLFGLRGGLRYGLRGGLSVGTRSPLFGGLLNGLLFGLLGGLSVMLVGHSKEIKPVEKVRWSWSAARYKWMSNLFTRLLGGLFFGLLVGLFGALRARPLGELLSELLDGLRGGLRNGLFFGLRGGLRGGLKDGLTIGEIRTQALPNEGIRRSVRNASISGLMVVLILVLMGGLFGGLFGGLRDGLFVGLLGGLRFGGHACLHHFALRLVLQRGFTPVG